MKREQKPKLAIGATYDYHDRAVKDRANQGSYMSYDTNDDGDIDGYFEITTSTIFVDMMFKYKGFSFMGEFANRTAPSETVQQSIVNDDASVTTRTMRVGTELTFNRVTYSKTIGRLQDDTRKSTLKQLQEEQVKNNTLSDCRSTLLDTR